MPQQSAQAERSATKRDQIVAAAGELFTRKGYAETSIDEIAATARVSKQTIYRYFDQKDDLLSAALTDRIRILQEPFDGFAAGVLDAGDVAEALRALARRVSDIVVRPDLAVLRRLVISETPRFPAIARDWSANGAQRVIHTLADLFRTLDAAGGLDTPDADVAAQHFLWLVVAAPLHTVLYAPDTEFTAAQRHLIADDGVRVFLAAYAPRSLDA